MPEITARLKTALADRYAIERERTGRIRCAQGTQEPASPSRREAIRRRHAGFRSLRDRLIPSVAVVSVTVPVTVAQFPVPPRERCSTGSPGSWVRGYFGSPGVPMTDPQAGKQPSSGTNRPVPGMRATGHWLDASST